MCPALFISAPGSHHGKTTITAALARYHVNQGRKVRVFKTGPDFLDPMVLETASGHTVYQLDLWLAGKTDCQRLLYEAALEADLILIEGVMGLFDGDPSSADIAHQFSIPILAVIDAKGTAQTLGAIAYGLAHFRQGLLFAGVLANNVASARHTEMIKLGFPQEIRFFGAIVRDQKLTLPERHLGLVQAEEICGLEARIDNAAQAIAATELTELPGAVEFKPSATLKAPKLLAGVRIGIAHDAAFSFIYSANLDFLRTMGAELVFFSPLTDETLPTVDSLYLPGGYPELHLSTLQNNLSIKVGLQQHFSDNKPLYAECGGMLYLLDSITDKDGESGSMVGIMSGQAVMQDHLQGLGYQFVNLFGGELRAHTFHHSIHQTSLSPFTTAERLFNTSAGEAVYKLNRLTASYLHCYFSSNPPVAAELFLP